MSMRLQFEGPDIDALLERVKDEHGARAQIVHAEQRLVGGVGGFFARRQFEVTVEVDQASSTPPAVDEVQPIDSISDLLARADQQDGQAPRLVSSLDRPVPDVDSIAGVGFHALLAPLLATKSEPVVEVVAAPTVASSGRPLGAVYFALHAVGLPPSALCREPLPPDARLALIEVLEREATPAPERVCGVLAVVGTATSAGAVARLIARRAGVPAGALVTAADVADVSVACDDPDGALDAVVRRTLRTHSVAVVVVEADGSRADAERAGSTCAVIDATTVVVAVDATRSIPVLRQWLTAVEMAGCRVDQVAAYDVAEHPEPASLLALHRPVTWLDGSVATVGAWASICLDRLPRV